MLDIQMGPQTPSPSPLFSPRFPHRQCQSWVANGNVPGRPGVLALNNRAPGVPAKLLSLSFKVGTTETLRTDRAGLLAPARAGSKAAVPAPMTSRSIRASSSAGSIVGAGDCASSSRSGIAALVDCSACKRAKLGNVESGAVGWATSPASVVDWLCGLSSCAEGGRDRQAECVRGLEGGWAAERVAKVDETRNEAFLWDSQPRVIASQRRECNVTAMV
jgi:hypothetical protein